MNTMKIQPMAESIFQDRFPEGDYGSLSASEKTALDAEAKEISDYVMTKWDKQETGGE